MAQQSGTRIGPYEIVAPLGAGGMGEVYRARDTRLGRDVAVKFSRERFNERSMREARTVAGLNHAKICALYDVGPDYLVMELVEGETLADRLQRGKLPVDEALTIAKQLADALEYAHERGIIHRDLKPANIKLTPDDQVKVLDFGLAKALDPDLTDAALGEAPTLTTPATLAGTILGTAAYMAPEQARGKAVDRRADIWAFGVVWFEMLTGARCFAGETTSDVLAAVIRAEPEWNKLPPELPPAQRRLLERCLRKDSRLRQQSMGDLRLALDEAADDNAATSLPVPAPPRRRAWTGWAGGAVAGVIAAALAAWWWAPWQQLPQPTSFRAITSLAGVQMDPVFSPDASSVAFVSNQDGDDNVYVSLIGGGTLLQVTHSPEEKSHPAWSPNGHLLVYAQCNAAGLWDLWEVPALGGTPRLILRDADDPAWSPDGQTLTYYRTSTGALWTSTPEGENAVEVAAPIYVRNGDPRFSPDGSEIAFVAKTPGPYGELAVVNRASKVVRQLGNGRDYMVTLSPAWSPDGRWIYYASGQSGAVNIWKMPATGGAAAQVTTGQGDDAQLDVSRDGRHLVFATFRTDSHIAQLDVSTKAVTMLTTDPARNQLAPQYSPDGKRLAYFTNLKGVELEQIWTSNADGTEAQPLVNDKRSNIFPRWTPDGNRIFFSTDAPFISDTPRQSRTVPSDGGTPQTVLPDQQDLYFDVGAGGRMLMATRQHQIASYDPATKRHEVLWAGGTGLVPFMARWSPDGQSFAFSVQTTNDEDANAGLWLCGIPCAAPKQIFRGWVQDFERGAGLIYIRAGSPDLHDPLWTVGWDGRGLTRLPVTLAMRQDYSGPAGLGLFAVSPDGRHIAFPVDDDLQATIGMLTFRK